LLALKWLVAFTERKLGAAFSQLTDQAPSTGACRPCHQSLTKKVAQLLLMLFIRAGCRDPLMKELSFKSIVSLLALSLNTAYA
jgi:hypothetical protein